MATKQENIQKDSWWINELDSLGVSVKVRNELNNIRLRQSKLARYSNRADVIIIMSSIMYSE